MDSKTGYNPVSRKQLIWDHHQNLCLCPQVLLFEAWGALVGLGLARRLNPKQTPTLADATCDRLVVPCVRVHPQPHACHHQLKLKHEAEA